MSGKKKIALFVGADITAQILMNRLMDDMPEGYEPIIFLPKHPESPRANLQELKRFAFYDRHLLQNVVYPFIEASHIHAPNRSPSTLARDLNLKLEVVDDVNSPQFIQKLAKEKDLVGGVSVRCFQIFKPEIIDVMNKKGFFLNLHPGILPQYRGVMSTFRTIAANEQQYGWTLHKVEKEIDAGEILWVKAKPLDLKKSGYSLNIDMASLGSQSIIRALEELEEGNVLKGYPQNAAEAKYYTYPTKEELCAWQKKGINLVDPDEVISILVEKFSQAGTSHGRRLSAELSKAIRAWEDSNPQPACPQTRRRRPAEQTLSMTAG